MRVLVTEMVVGQSGSEGLSPMHPLPDIMSYHKILTYYSYIFFVGIPLQGHFNHSLLCHKNPFFTVPFFNHIYKPIIMVLLMGPR
jgi:hypothetical protein